MELTEAAKKYHERLFPGYESKFMVNEAVAKSE